MITKAQKEAQELVDLQNELKDLLKEIQVV
jgi:hypothetical protein